MEVKTPKSRPCQLQARKKYYDKNKESIHKQQAEYYKLHCETIKANKKVLYQAKKAKELLERGGLPKPRKPRTKKKKPIAGRPAAERSAVADVIIEEVIVINDSKIP